MPARTGQQYIDGLSNNPAEVWIRGEKVDDVTTHPAFQNGVRSLASLYDQQQDSATKDAMTFKSPSSGEPVGLSFIIPKTIDDLVKRREMMTNGAWESCGMRARAPDFLNNAVLVFRFDFVIRERCELITSIEERCYQHGKQNARNDRRDDKSAQERIGTVRVFHHI